MMKTAGLMWKTTARVFPSRSGKRYSAHSPGWTTVVPATPAATGWACPLCAGFCSGTAASRLSVAARSWAAHASVWSGLAGSETSAFERDQVIRFHPDRHLLTQPEIEMAAEQCFELG